MTTSYLAFDLGAESGRAILGRLADGRLAIEELHRFPDGMIALRGHRHWNVPGLLAHLRDGLRAAAQRDNAELRSIGIDTWGVDFALLAGEEILGLPYAYRDRRTDGAMDSFFRKMPRAAVYHRTGIQLLPINTLFQLEAMVRDRSPLLAAATDLLFIPDLFYYLLGGEKQTEFTFATTSQLFNPLTMDWDADLLAALGLSRSLLRPVVPPGTMVGRLDAETAAATGLGRIPLAAVATHDTGSAVAATPAEGEDWAFLSSGTWSLMGFEAHEPVISAASLAANFTNEGGIGGTFRVLKNIMGLWLLQECRRAWAPETPLDYATVAQMATAAPPFGSFVDPDDPAFLAPPDMPAAIAAYCRRTGQPAPENKGATARLVLESLALKYRLVLEQIRELSGRPINRIHVIGGGSQNRLLCQLTADATGVPVYAGPAEATAIGNLLVQAMADGTIGSPAELRSVVKRSCKMERYEPRGRDDWEEALARFRALLSRANESDHP
ncbi:MAG: rhamnulokinase [Myxococcales bacterium]|nr:rhamnulokinase [Myxococcales bacterium]